MGYKMGIIREVLELIVYWLYTIWYYKAGILFLVVGTGVMFFIALGITSEQYGIIGKPLIIIYSNGTYDLFTNRIVDLLRLG